MLDTYGRAITYLRMSVTDLCNLRCRYCMPAEGVCKRSHEDMLTEDEMITAVRAAAGLGVTKLRITGGEPLVKKNIISICERAAAVDGIEEVCITTNGILLPKYAKELVGAGVRHINISLDTLDADKYADMTRIGDIKDSLAGFEAALEAGFETIKLNSVLIAGFNDNEIGTLAELSVKYPVDIRFIELMPMVEGAFSRDAYISCDEVLKVLPELESTGSDGVARMYRLPGAKGRVGLISPVSAHFCAECNRLRLTADGRLKPCLHSPAEYPIKGLTEEEMKKVMEDAILAKPAQHPPLGFDSLSKAGRSMNRIGG